MKVDLKARFDRYCEAIVNALGHARRKQPGRWYLLGLVLPGQRKSVEPMAARVAPDNTPAAHQAMHHIVAQANWDDEAVLSATAEQVVPELTRHGDPVVWIVDDTGLPKKGEHSVGVAHQYCGELGKQANCRVAVSLSVATRRGSLPVAWRLYLPQQWSEDPARCRQAGVPEAVDFATKPTLALRQIEAAVAAGYPVGTILADAAYGDEAQWRARIAELQLTYAVGIRATTTVWWGAHQPIELDVPPKTAPRGRSRKRLGRDRDHQPIAVADVARELSPDAWQTVTWRDGSAGTLSSRFARVRVRAARDDRPRAHEWLIIEWPEEAAEPTHYWLSNLPVTIDWQALVETLMSRWQIERDYQELKSELGLGDYEGRNWRGFHHHASLCIAAYGFLLLERLAGSKKKASPNSRRLAYPQPGASGARRKQRHIPNSIATWRNALIQAIAATLPRCPCCGQEPSGLCYS
jgi:SRSO17 transposase